MSLDLTKPINAPIVQVIDWLNTAILYGYHFKRLVHNLQYKNDSNTLYMAPSYNFWEDTRANKEMLTILFNNPYISSLVYPLYSDVFIESLPNQILDEYEIVGLLNLSTEEINSLKATVVYEQQRYYFERTGMTVELAALIAAKTDEENFKWNKVHASARLWNNFYALAKYPGMKRTVGTRFASLTYKAIELLRTFTTAEMNNRLRATANSTNPLHIVVTAIVVYILSKNYERT